MAAPPAPRPPVRRARAGDMERVYLMGLDAWGAGASPADYLASCRASPKYAEGTWYVLAAPRRPPTCSLIVYRLFAGAAGIGSVATAVEERGKGLASRLVGGVLRRLDRAGVRHVFLFSDIAPRFYERFGFTALPSPRQRKPGSVCMLRSEDAAALLGTPGFEPPAYF